MSSDVVFRAFPVPAEPATEGPSTSALELDRAEERRAAAMEPVSASRFRAGRIALRRFTAELMGVPAAELVPHYACPQCGQEGDRAHGRPGYAVNGKPVPLLLSLARAGDWILLAALPAPSAGLRLGVDVEDPAAVGFPGFDAAVLSPGEAALVAKEPAARRNAARARLWVRKEAWLKMEGSGLRTEPAAVEVLVLPGLRDLVPAETGLPRHLAAALALG